MCAICCLNKKTYKVCRIVPVWVFFLIVMLITFAENLIFLVDPLYMLPSLFVSITMLPGLCSCRSLKIRNCIWITYLIVALIQLLVAVVAFCLLIAFPNDEECT